MNRRLVRLLAQRAAGWYLYDNGHTEEPTAEWLHEAAATEGIPEGQREAFAEEVRRCIREAESAQQDYDAQCRAALNGEEQP